MHPAVRVFRSDSVAIASDVQTPIPFEAARFDGPGLPMFDPLLPTRLTAQVPGRYQISGAIIWEEDPAGSFRNVGIRVNGTTYVALLSDPPIANADAGQAISTFFELAAGDYVELVVEQNSGGPLLIVKTTPPFDAASPEFMMVKI